MRAVFAALIVGVVWAQPNPPQKQPQPQKQNQKGQGKTEKKKEVPLFVVKAGQTVPVSAILEYIHRVTGREVITSSTVMTTMGRGDRVPGLKVTFATSFKADYEVLKAVLAINGITIRETTRGTTPVLEVYTAREVTSILRYGPTPVVEEKEVPKEHELVTAVVRLKHADPTQVERVLGLRLLTRMGPGQMITVPGQPVVIIRHFSEDVRYYLKLIRLIDVEPKKPKLYIYKLKNAVAQDVANYLTQLTRMQIRPTRGQAIGAGLVASFVADSRTNKLVTLTFPENWSEIERIIKELDEELPEERGTIHIVQLKNVDAEKLAQSLQQILQGRQQRQQRVRQPGTAQPVPARVVAEKQTNSLIIEAEKEDFDELQKIIKRLDVRRPQVMIEAAIVEVSADSTTNLGIELASVDLAGVGYRGAFATLFGLSTINAEEMTKTPNAGIGLTALVYKDSLDRIPFLLQMMRATTDVNVLSSPRILTNDNEKGMIKVTDQVAIVTTIDTQTQQTRTTFGGYQEAGITLEITPHISAGRYLRLELNLTIESFTGQPVPGAAVPPPKTSRQIQGVVTVPDGHLVIIGGLTSEKLDETTNKIPFLGDIPIIGVLFRSTSTMRRKTNLYIFIRPYILGEENFETLKAISRQQLRKAQKEGGKTELLRSALVPEIRPWEERKQVLMSQWYYEMVKTFEEMFSRDFRMVRVPLEER